MEDSFISINGIVVPSRIEENVLKDNVSEFIFSPLKGGFSYTVGNSLRRVLLSSIEGYAIYYIKIAGALHEFSVIEGVYQDMIIIVQNLKKLRIKKIVEEEVNINDSFDDDYEIVHIKGIDKLHDKEIFTGADINRFSKKFKVVNEEAEIFKISKDINFDVEIGIKKGLGWAEAKEFKVGVDTDGVIYVDSIFSPVSNVKIRIEDARIGSDVCYDTLILEISTDYTITPREALKKAIHIMNNIFESFCNSEIVMFDGDEMKEIDVKSMKYEQLLKCPIRDLDFSARTLNGCNNAGIETVADLLSYSYEDLIKLKNLGDKSCKEVEQKLQERGLSLKKNEF